MDKESRVRRFEVSVSPHSLKRVAVTRGAWYESPEEIEAGLAWGRRKAELFRWVRKHMGRGLTLRERRCIELHFFRAMSCRDVGLATGTTPSSVQRALNRALQKLRRSARDFRAARARSLSEAMIKPDKIR